MRRAIVRRRAAAWNVAFDVAPVPVVGVVGDSVCAVCRQPGPTSTCAATSVTLTNQNPYPIWIGENVGTGAILLPDNSANWELGAGDSIERVCAAGLDLGNFLGAHRMQLRRHLRPGPGRRLRRLHLGEPVLHDRQHLHANRPDDSE